MRYSLFAFAAVCCVVLAVPMPVLADAVPPLVNYQGKVYQPSGAAVPDGAYRVAFSVYDVPTGGTAIWTETYDALLVKGSAFHVLLGSINPIGASIFSTADRYLGVKLGTDPELTPRQKIASVPYAMVAEKVPAGTIGTTELAPAAVTAEKLAPGIAVPTGTVVMWSGAADAIPYGWALCDGTNGTPDLRDRFVVGAGAEYAVGATGGEKQHQLTVAEMPSHSHGVNDPGHAHGYIDWTMDRGSGWAAGSEFNWLFAERGTNAATTGINLQSAGGNQPHENRPPYYALCFIMKVAG